MLDLRTLSDAEVVELLGLARGYDRELLVQVLGFSHGDEGVPLLRTIVDERGRGSTQARAFAMGALGRRLGPGAVPEVAPSLHEGNLLSQLAAVTVIQRIDDGTTAVEVFGWLERRLRASTRARTWGNYEVSGVLRYAMRVGGLPGFLDVLESTADRLQPEEQRLLDRAWPRERRDQFRATGDEAHGPDASLVDEWFGMNGGESTDQEELAALTDQAEPVISRLRQRREKASG